MRGKKKAKLTLREDNDKKQLISYGVERSIKAQYEVNRYYFQC